MLELTTVQKSFNGKAVLDIPSLQLGPGIYWLKGANGSGKSTLLKILGGLLPFRGDVKLEGISQTKEPVAYRHLVNHSPAEPVFPAFISGDELVDFTKAIKKGSSQQISFIKEALEVGAYTANPTGSYSSGMLKKLSLLLAFTGQPKWILLDEPFTTLDIAAQQNLQTLIRQQTGSGISFILTSHHDVETPDLRFTRVFHLQDTQLKEL